MRPDWLPSELVFNGGDVERDYERLHNIYQNEILAQDLFINNIPIAFDGTLDPDFSPYSRGFTHLITRDNGDGFRGIDYARAVKLCWIVPVIENYTDPAVSCFWYETPVGETLTVWLEDHDFLMILKWQNSSKQQKILVTSYNVDAKNRKYYASVRARPTSRPL